MDISEVRGEAFRLGSVETVSRLETIGRRLPPPLARQAKRAIVYPRYVAQLRACRRGYRGFGHLYSQRILFIAGLPKSGTTWLERMVASAPGFHTLLIPRASVYELEHGGSHDFDLPPDMFRRFREMLVVTKMHSHGSRENVRVLRTSGVKYVVLYRDLRDVAVSHLFYVRRTPWHPEHSLYARRSLTDGLTVFAERTLGAFAQWIESWHANADPDLGLIIRYEDLLDDPQRVMGQVVDHFELGLSPEAVSAIVKAHSFAQLSGGRPAGEVDEGSFFRSGVVGDWRKYFTRDLADLYARQVGRVLAERGYEG